MLTFSYKTPLVYPVTNGFQGLRNRGLCEIVNTLRDNNELEIDMETFTKQIKIGKETREVEFKANGYGPGDAFHEAVSERGAFRKNGGKVWEAPLVWIDNGEDQFLQNTKTFLNKSGYKLTGFADEAKANHSQHNSAAR